ncbi:hypothetical protein ANN_21588 [Periplaneta americana]|uniref:Uncharacterized protein n=1 Tax=Periplaneta americana TaxID=6978 RepID=A0ABQ8S5V6_PERAM|nr:hypothetical protein ANN_21588 [Periplaneta americana]
MVQNTSTIRTLRNMIREDCYKNDLPGHTTALSLSSGCRFNKTVPHSTGRCMCEAHSQGVGYDEMIL